MNRMSTSKKISVGAAALFSLGVLVNISAMESNFGSDCECLAASTTNISHSITHDPISHSNCIAQTQDTISWFDWIGGKSPSYQFHFLDLLELLYGDDASNDQMPQRPGGSV